MRTIDGYLSRHAQQVHPDAVVTHQDQTDYRLEREGAEPVGLGPSFGQAQQAIYALKAAHRARAPRD